MEPASDAQDAVDWVHRILKEERDLVTESSPLEATAFEVEGIRMAYVFYESGLSINVMYDVEAAGKRAVGFKLSDGMEIPAELASQFKFAARSRSWPGRSAARTSRSRASTDHRPCSAGDGGSCGPHASARGQSVSRCGPRRPRSAPLPDGDVCPGSGSTSRGAFREHCDQRRRLAERVSDDSLVLDADSGPELAVDLGDRRPATGRGR